MSNLESSPLRTFIGGRRTGLLNATWPLVRLVILEDRIEMQPSVRWLRHAVPPWEASFAEITEARAVGRIKYVSAGVRFRTTRRDGWAVFWTTHRAEVLDALEIVGLRVDRSILRFNILNPTNAETMK